MTSQLLTKAQRKQVLARIHEALGNAHPELYKADELNRPGGVKDLESHLDSLIAIARRSTADSVEPYLAEIVEDVCADCPHQHVNGHCPLRHTGQCVTFVDAALVMNAIRSALRDLHDPEYWAHHFLHDVPIS